MKVKTIENDLDFLRQISEDVDFTDDLTNEIKELEKYLLKSKGFALSAIQLGYKNRVIYVRCSNYKKLEDENYNEAEILINPVITRSEGLTTYFEACLSCMDNTAIVCRPYRIQISYYDINGIKKEKTIEGFPSTIICHEYDHLNGILHIDKGLEVINMNKEERKEFRKKYDYKIYEEDGNFEDLISTYKYDSNSKTLFKM